MTAKKNAPVKSAGSKKGAAKKGASTSFKSATDPYRGPDLTYIARANGPTAEQQELTKEIGKYGGVGPLLQALRTNQTRAFTSERQMARQEPRAEEESLKKEPTGALNIELEAIMQVQVETSMTLAGLENILNSVCRYRDAKTAKDEPFGNEFAQPTTAISKVAAVHNLATRNLRTAQRLNEHATFLFAE